MKEAILNGQPRQMKVHKEVYWSSKVLQFPTLSVTSFKRREGKDYQDLLEVLGREKCKIIKLVGYSGGNKDYMEAKKPQGNWKETPTLGELEIKKWLKQGGWVGLVIPEGKIVIDEDNLRLGAALLKSFKKTLNMIAIKTPNGYQFCFDDNGMVRSQTARTLTAGGLCVDYRLPGKGYIVLPTRNTADRRIVHFCTEALDPMPLIFTPVRQIKPYEESLDIPISEGMRDDTLFRHASRLRGWNKHHKLGLNDNERLQILNEMNAFLCEPPLPERDVEAKLASAERYQDDAHTVSQVHSYRDQETVKLKVSSIADIFRAPDPEYLIKGLLVQNTLTTLSAQPGVGKSLFALQCAHAVVTGKKLFGLFRIATKGPVLIVDEETPPSFLKSRLKGIGFTEDMPVHFLHLQHCKIDNTLIFEQLVEVIKDIQPVLVILDPLIRIHSSKENDATDMAAVMDRLRSIVNLNTTLTELVIHHNRKASGEQSMRGSSDILAGVDLHLLLEEKGDCLTLSSPKSRYMPIKPFKLRIAADEGKLALEYVGEALDRKEELIENIIDVLMTCDSDDGMSFKQIFNSLKEHGQVVGEKKLRDTLNSAVGKELSEKTIHHGCKLYRLKNSLTRPYIPKGNDAVKVWRPKFHNLGKWKCSALGGEITKKLIAEI